MAGYLRRLAVVEIPEVRKATYRKRVSFMTLFCICRFDLTAAPHGLGSSSSVMFARCLVPRRKLLDKDSIPRLRRRLRGVDRIYMGSHKRVAISLRVSVPKCFTVVMFQA